MSTRHFDRDHHAFADDARWEEQASDPATPAAGERKVFAKSDGFYEIDDTGTVQPLGGGGIAEADVLIIAAYRA